MPLHANLAQTGACPTRMLAVRCCGQRMLMLTQSTRRLTQLMKVFLLSHKALDKGQLIQGYVLMSTQSTFETRDGWIICHTARFEMYGTQAQSECAWMGVKLQLVKLLHSYLIQYDLLSEVVKRFVFASTRHAHTFNVGLFEDSQHAKFHANWGVPEEGVCLTRVLAIQ